jgi:hypothetical protein
MEEEVEETESKEAFSTREIYHRPHLERRLA